MKEKISGFKGLEVSDMKLVVEKTKCSSALESSCGLRDCNLEIYHIGDEKVYSGGLCPKGNTSSHQKSAPNYVRTYQRLLEDKISQYTTPLENPTENQRILIPRSLSFLNELGVFYTSLYANLGYDVSVSPESNDEIVGLGISQSHSEFCFPMKLAHGHAAYLQKFVRSGEKDSELDKILLVNAISSEKEKFKFCPYVESAGFTIRGNLGLDTNEVLLPVIRFNDPDYPIHKEIKKDLDRVFGKSHTNREVKQAVGCALKDQSLFNEETYSKGRESLNKAIEKDHKIFLGVARGYTIFDDKASSSVHELFSKNGLHFFPANLIGPERKDIEEIVHNMYWNQGRKMIEQTAFAIENGYFPVRLTNFNCGPDSILHSHEKNMVESSFIPWLVLETDGHNSNAQFGTRIQAHNRVVESSKTKPTKINKRSDKSKDIDGRILGIPYMGEDSYVAKATINGLGLSCEVIPTATKRSREIAKKIVDSNTCKPFSYQVGDHLAWFESLNNEGLDPNTYAALFLPSAQGPCRFGQYVSVLEGIFTSQGYGAVPIISPSSSDGYQIHELPFLKKLQGVTTFIKGSKTRDLLENMLLRFRPYEKTVGDSQTIYETRKQEILKLVERNSGLRQLRKVLVDSAEDFNKVPTNSEKRKPLALMNGEIYMRLNEHSNQNSIDLLEKNGLEVILEPVSGWIDYIMSVTLDRAMETKHIAQMAFSYLNKSYVDFVERNLSRPIMQHVGDRIVHGSYSMIKQIEQENIFSSAIQGEAGISIAQGKAFMDGHLDIDGIFHVGPLGCMQETIATSRLQALFQKKRKEGTNKEQVIPFMDAVFGEAYSDLDPQIAIFAENCRIHSQIRRKKGS